jgi:hypothetical protein
LPSTSLASERSRLIDTASPVWPRPAGPVSHGALSPVSPQHSVSAPRVSPAGLTSTHSTPPDTSLEGRYRGGMRDLAAVSWAPDRIDLFWVDETGALWHQPFDGDTWLAPESLGGTLASGPAVTAWAVDQLEVFAIFPDGELYDRYWDGESWHPWESLGGDLDPSGQPAASSWSADRLDVFAPGRDGRTWHRWWDGSRWVDWEQFQA